MTDIVLYDILDEQKGNQHTYARIYEIEYAICHTVKPRSYRMMDEFNGGLEQNCRKTAGNTDKKRKNDHPVTLRHAFDETAERGKDI